MSSTDRITKSIDLAAPLERVWKAIADSSAFGAWFGIAFDGPFVAGKPCRGTIVPTRVDPEVAAMQAPHQGTPVEFFVDRIEAPRLFSFRWHPFAIDREADYSNEPTTLIEFTLEEIARGTRLRITESGFDQIPLERRAKAFAANEGGWEHQTKLVEKYLAGHGA